MARKIGDAVVAMTILFFVITAFSMFLVDADQKTEVDSGIAKETMSELEKDSSTFRNMIGDAAEKSHKTDKFQTGETAEETQVGGGIWKLKEVVTSNVVTRFFGEVMQKFPQASMVIGMLVLLATVTAIVLGARAFMGQHRI